MLRSCTKQPTTVERITLTAIAFPIPDDVIAIADGIEGFLRREVFPRHQSDHAAVRSASHVSDDGRYVPAVVDHIRGVRIAPQRWLLFHVGACGTGWGRHGHACLLRCGSVSIVFWQPPLAGCFAVSHWAFGPPGPIESDGSCTAPRFRGHDGGPDIDVFWHVWSPVPARMRP